MPRTDECFELCLTEDEYAYLRYLMATREASNINETQRRHLWDKLNYANDLAHNPNMLQAREIVAQYRTIRRRYASLYMDSLERIPAINMVINKSVLEDPHSREYLDEHIPEENVRWHVMDIDYINQANMWEADVQPIFAASQMRLEKTQVNLKDLYRQYIADDNDSLNGFHLTFEIRKASEKKLGFFEE